MQHEPNQVPNDSDLLPWTLAAAAILIMAIAVRINAGEASAPGPAVHDPGEQNRETQRPEHSPAHPPARV